MKVLVLTLLCIAVAVAVPIELDANTQLSLADIDNEQAISNDENPQEVSRSKRFILKKIVLAKAGALGLGALGIAGAAVAAKGAIGSAVGGLGGLGGLSGGLGGGLGGLGSLGGKFGGSGHQSYGSGHQSYGSGYWNKPSLPVTSITSYPSTVYPAPQPTYYTSQSYGPPAYNTIDTSYGGGIATTSAVVGYAPNQIQAAPTYGFRSAAVPPPPNGKPFYVVCDQQ